MSDENAPVEKEKSAEPAKPVEEKPPIVTSHSLNLGNTALDYTVTTGLMPLKDDKDETKAHIFYMAYVVPLPEHAAPRPLTFVFNGGPGSSSVWLHLGAVGPKRVKMEDEGWMPPPPYQLVDNPHTWLDLTDLVFIDPVGTGYSRPVKPDDGKNYWSVQGDLESVGEFIRLYLTRNSRWTSPLYLAGESYGTTRAAGLSGYLVDKGIAFNGLLLISTVANFQTLEFERGNDLPYVLFLPTYTATAWYHQKLPADLLARPLEDVLREVEAWAANEYAVALMQGNQLQGKKRAAVVKQLARYTGLEARHIEQSNLRIQIFRFCKELLRDQNRTVGRLDSRFKGMDALAVTEFPEFDPSMQAILPPYTAMLNQYMRTALRYETDVPYEILSFNVNRGWEWERGKYPDTSEALRSALAKNPYMRVFLGMGYYDLATPHFATQYTLSHLEIDPSIQPNLVWAGYPAGHMFYLDVPSLEKLKGDVRGFMG
ncbi:MAG: peptidase S10 [Anaerolineae bacterium]|nr:peptidase S10 [Anaerolineae bacterium]